MDIKWRLDKGWTNVGQNTKTIRQKDNKMVVHQYDNTTDSNESPTDLC
jgi:hypothetical protein